MKETRLETFLYCNDCKQEQDHVISYLNKRISEIECQVCQRRLSMQIDLSHELYDELFTRIRTKPARMTEEYRRHVSQFLLTLPARVAGNGRKFAAFSISIGQEKAECGRQAIPLSAQRKNLQPAKAD